MHLKPEDAEDELHDYTAEWKIKELVKRYSDFIAWPIRMEVERRTPATEEGGEEQITIETQTINSMKALWAKSKDEVTDEEYKEFYKHIAHAWDDPLEIIPMKAEGTFEYHALLFIPSHAPFDLFSQDAKRGVQLYVKRVFIMDDCDAADADVPALRQGRRRRAGHVAQRVPRDPAAGSADQRDPSPADQEGALDDQGHADRAADDYRTFWTQFGRVLKEGLMSDFDNRDTLLEISSFASTHSDEELTTLAEYVERMKEGQEQIYYVTGDSRQQVENSPHLEAFKAKGYEVLLLTDPVDEVWVGLVPEFDGKPLQSVAKGEVDLESEEGHQRGRARGAAERSSPTC